MGITVNPDLPVLIAGAGPGGLALAQGLRKRNIPFRVFERDADDAARGQGWAVALQWTIPELKANIPSDLPPLETVSHLHHLGLKTQIAPFISGAPDLPWKEEGDDFLRADRLKLRDYLATHLNVEWGKRIHKFEETEKSVIATFEDGTTAEGCCLIGADGGKSHVRAQLVANTKLDASPFDTILGNLKLNRKEYTELWKQIARSVTVVQGKETFLFIGLHEISEDQEESDWYWMIFRPKDKNRENGTPDDWSKEKLQEQAIKWTEEFEPKFKDLVKRTPVEGYSPMSSFVETWSPPEEGFSTEKVTLIGDAAHKMTPRKSVLTPSIVRFANEFLVGGVGVNHAFQDTFDICRLFESKSSIAEAFKEYDTGVSKRGREAVKKATKWPVLGNDW